MTAPLIARHDVVVVGARAAGAATALLLARLGHDVALVDRAVFPSDTISTHQIARPGVVQLARWGLLDDVLASGAPALRDVHFTAGGETVSRRIRDAAGVDLLIAPRRHVLDTLLVEAAVHAGADLRTGVSVSGVLRGRSGRVAGVTGCHTSGHPVVLDARYVIGADGLTSGIARSVGAPFTQRRGDDGSAEYAYFDGVPWDGIELYAAEGALAGVFPTHDGAACVWITSRSADARAARRQAGSRSEALLSRLTQHSPELAARLRGARQASPVAGMLRMPNHVRKAYGPGWALVGDAGYHRDAVTGHGLSDAYRDAELLAVALDEALRGAGDDALGTYERARDAALREVFELTCALAAYPAVPRFVELQKQLSRAYDAEATQLALRPIPGERTLVPA